MTLNPPETILISMAYRQWARQPHTAHWDTLGELLRLLEAVMGYQELRILIRDTLAAVPQRHLLLALGDAHQRAWLLKLTTQN